MARQRAPQRDARRPQCVVHEIRQFGRGYGLYRTCVTTTIDRGLGRDVVAYSALPAVRGLVGSSGKLLDRRDNLRDRPMPTARLQCVLLNNAFRTGLKNLPKNGLLNRGQRSPLPRAGVGF